MNNKINKPSSSNPFDIFIVGARKGFYIAANHLIPNILMAYVIAQILNLLGIIHFLEQLFSPLMSLFGLPDVASTVLLTAWFSASASIGVVLSLIAQEQLTSLDTTILLPAIFLMGSQLQYIGRLLRIANVPRRYWPILMITSILNAFISMSIMKIII
jgi:spore maturation protein SpmB